MNKEKQKLIIPLEINIIVTQKQNKPCIEFRKNISDIDIIKKIVYAALNEKSLVFLPKFTNKLNSINSLIEKGIIYYNADTDTLEFVQ